MIIRFLKTWFLVLIVFALSPLHGQDSLKNSFNERVEQFFLDMQMGNYEQAVDFIYSDNPWIAKKYEDIQAVKDQFIGLPGLVGKYQNHTILIKEMVVNRYVFLHYFVAFERQPVSFTFEFYKPNDKWMIYSFSFADDVDTWIEERAKRKFISSGTNM
jgi:hypothetical protein